MIRARAIANGVKMTPHQIKEALRRRDAGDPMREFARSYNVSHSTVSWLHRGRTRLAEAHAPSDAATGFTDPPLNG